MSRRYDSMTTIFNPEGINVIKFKEDFFRSNMQSIISTMQDYVWES